MKVFVESTTDSSQCDLVVLRLEHVDDDTADDHVDDCRQHEDERQQCVHVDWTTTTTDDSAPPRATDFRLIT